MGIEWNLLGLDDAERTQLAEMVALHQRFRPLLHGGDAVRFDPLCSGPDVTALAHGVYAADRREALVSVAQLATGISLAPPPLRLPGLDSAAVYSVTTVPLPRQGWSMGRSRVAVEDGGVRLTGRQLAAHGVQVPPLNPDSVVLLHLTAD